MKSDHKMERNYLKGFKVDEYLLLYSFYTRFYFATESYRTNKEVKIFNLFLTVKNY
jgi:hypothetical protein